MDYVKCCFYGSLRKDMYNYERFLRIYGKESMKYIETRTLKGYQLKDLRFYPAAIAGTLEDIMVVDLFEVSKDCAKHIKDMELGAGYKEITLDINKETFYMFIMTDRLKERPTVQSGDWIKYCKEQEVEKQLAIN